MPLATDCETGAVPLTLLTEAAKPVGLVFTVMVTFGLVPNVAVTFLLVFSVRDAGLVVPVRSTDHPRNDCPVPGTAVRVTVVPQGKLPVPVGLTVTVPLPTVVTVSVHCGCMGMDGLRLIGRTTVTEVGATPTFKSFAVKVLVDSLKYSFTLLAFNDAARYEEPSNAARKNAFPGVALDAAAESVEVRSEERRVGKEGRSRGS